MKKGYILLLLASPLPLNHFRFRAMPFPLPDGCELSEGRKVCLTKDRTLFILIQKYRGGRR
jgi:hypothetical protein